MSNIQDYQAREHLLTVLKERGIVLGSDDVSWAFASNKTRDQSIVWVKEYLQDVTLLTKDELDMLDSGTWSTALGLPTNLDQVILQDSNLKFAIESLQSSTAMIEKHTKTLEAQRDALKAFRAHKNSDMLVDQSPRKTLGDDMNKANFTFEESMHTLKENFDDTDQEISRAMNSLNSVVTERLGADDEVLQALSNLASKTVPAKQARTVDPVTIDQWCHALTMLRENETNAKIDTAIYNYIYDIIESGNNGMQNNHGPSSSEEELEAELRTLREEIPSVVELVVGSELRQPLQRLMQNSQQQAITSQREWLHYVLDTFNHMINQLNLIGAHTTKLHAYTNAISEVRSAFESLKVEGTSFASTAQNTALAQSGPSRPTMHARSDSRAAASNGTLAEQTCKRFSIARPSAEALKAASESSVAKMLEQYSSATASTTDLVAKAMDEQHQNLQTAMGQLYTHSSFASVELLPKDLETNVKALDEAIAATAVGLESAEKGKHDGIKQVIAQVREKLR